MGQNERAVVHVRNDGSEEINRCVYHCVARGYEVVAVTHGGDGWIEAWRMLLAGRADVLVKADVWDLPSCVEVAGHPHPG